MQVAVNQQCGSLIEWTARELAAESASVSVADEVLTIDDNAETLITFLVRMNVDRIDELKDEIEDCEDRDERKELRAALKEYKKAIKQFSKALLKLVLPIVNNTEEADELDLHDETAYLYALVSKRTYIEDEED